MQKNQKQSDPKPQAQAERMMPQNLEAERALLGSVLLDSSALHLVTETITQDDLYSHSNRLIFEAMLALWDNSRSIELVSIVDILRSAGTLEAVGGSGYVAALMDNVPIGATTSVREYCQIVKDKSTLRRLINSSNNIVARCFEQTDDPQDLIGSAHSQLLELGQKEGNGIIKIGDFLDQTFRDGSFNRMMGEGGQKQGIPTGFLDLDALTAGIQPGELSIIAARPSVGKSALMLDIARYASGKGIPTGIFSLEMSRYSLLQRLVSAEGSIDSHKMRSGFCGREEWDKAMRAAGRMANWPLWLDDTASLSLRQFRGKLLRMIHDCKIQLAIIDYLQLMRGDGRQESRNQEVTQISGTLKKAAKDNNLAVVALSQLSRAGEGYGKRNVPRKPQLSDLRESGAIEQDADLVIFLHRPKKKGEEDEDEGPGIVIEVDVAKQRNGPTGLCKLVFLKPYTRFENVASQSNDEPPRKDWHNQD